MAAPFVHIPVLAREVIELLQPQSGGHYIDGTVGGGNHAALILVAAAPDGFLLGIDQDQEALAAAEQKLAPFAGRFMLRQGNFAEIAAVAEEAGLKDIDGILLDIGVSSYQLDNPNRGFSYMQDAPLDMRMNQSSAFSARELVNQASAAELTRIFYEYGEEKWAKRIAAFIVEARARKPVDTTGELVEIIKKAVPSAARDKDQHPAKRTFQALRIAVNDELAVLEQGLEGAISLLKPGGVLAVISFHSLEDRIVKEKFKLHATECICPPRTPVCTCGHHADLKILTKKPLTAQADELAANPRSRSALLRAARKR